MVCRTLQDENMGPLFKNQDIQDRESRALHHTRGPSQHKTLGSCIGCMPWKLALFFFFFNNFIYLFLAVLEPRAFRSFVWAFSASGEQGYFLVAVVSLAVEHRLWGARPQ